MEQRDCFLQTPDCFCVSFVAVRSFAVDAWLLVLFKPFPTRNDQFNPMLSDLLKSITAHLLTHFLPNPYR